MTLCTSTLAQWTVNERRFLHQYPELSGEEYQTAAYIRKWLQEWQIELMPCEPPSVVGFLRGTDGSKTIALRADIDALPVNEEGLKSYLSKNPGVAHVCGHDGHTAILLATAKWLSENRGEVRPNVLFLFQSSEEMLPSGAEALVRQGVMDNVDAVFGLHLWQPLEKGKIGISTGAMMASSDDLRIVITGHGGHGSMPHETIDPIYVASQVIAAVQGVVSRRVNPIEPAVISICRMESGTTYNIIPNQAILYGTIRAQSEKTRRLLATELKQTIEALCSAWGAIGEVIVDWGTPPVVNDKGMSEYVAGVVTEHFGAEVLSYVEPVMGGEDFSYYLEKKPGSFVFIGMGGEKSSFPHHHPRFDIDEDVIPTGVELFIQLVKDFD
ncbi:N-acyl-L-amino acid amidohydrolase [Brevibacillus reuszeri]|uniref:N-acyl-L-amino acid amidohydrolase n=1 Tax=Brevibacillus reuszeri TaxID=54915 RepID=A0A0K9YJH7_9BACL|nr:amidohydrolase [Brevibacillus reuszeri]KNB68821.1 N-acyl-L-amino acid amidohydrolase [Brevibacillus reuszeri]MED1859128.1 amidohydrolase [Brevibacillus reuszeri]GED69347.1 N-acyl-L-amino acid amidohydrolase [Brevibacillus reuszeri]